MNKKAIIEQVLRNTWKEIEKDSQEYTRTEKMVEFISDVMPTDLSSYMAENLIPRSATFESGGEHGLKLVWELPLPTTEQHRLDYKRELYAYHVSSRMREVLSGLGYKFSIQRLMESSQYVTRNFRLMQAGKIDEVVDFYSDYFHPDGDCDDTHQN